ncbi:cyclase family protein [Tepidiforma sp.]|uniref:cyclase family protein n=1 Tax=Tepidiforma sp. TaxID=2682230 RepID=UPI002ADD8FCB|nr:cyclase family protein [Tepidiforma sp.]
MAIPDPLPRFDQLPAVPDAPPQSAWWLFGRDDDIGMFNLQTPERIAAAARLVQRGAMFPLNWNLELPNPPLFNRGALRQTIFGGAIHHDDVLDNFYPQASSQWDTLVHVGNSRHGFYNGIRKEEVTGKPGSRGGIDRWAQRGIAGRAVLLDLGRFLASRGEPIDFTTDRRFSVDELEACRQAQGVEFAPGDVLLIRTGWTEWYESLDAPARSALANMAAFRAPGIAAGEAMAEYLWNRHFAAIAGDLPSLEAWPPRREHGGFLHEWLLGMFGMAIGELWDLSRLAADCAADGRYEAFLVSAPLNKTGGIGSPPNAIAFK